MKSTKSAKAYVIELSQHSLQEKSWVSQTKNNHMIHKVYIHSFNLEMKSNWQEDSRNDSYAWSKRETQEVKKTT